MRGTPIVLTDFSGGVNARDAVYQINNNQTPDAANIISSERGAIIKRNGIQSWATAFTAPNFVLNTIFFSQDSQNTVVMGQTSATVGNKIYSLTSAGTVTDRTGALGATVTTSWAVAEGPPGNTIYMVPTIGTPQKWDQSTATTATYTASSGTIPRGYSMAYHGNRMWGFNGGTSLLFWTNVLDPLAWGAGDSGFVEIDSGNGIITHIQPLGPYLVVFKSNSTYLVYDLDTGANRQVSSQIGLDMTSRKSVAVGPDGLYFMSNRGTAKHFDGVTFTTISDRINPHFAGRSCLSGTYASNHYYFTLNSATVGAYGIYDYDIVNDTWWYHTSATAWYQDMATWNVDGVEYVIAVSNVSGTQARVDKLFVDGVTQDNGSNFTGYWTQPWFPMGQPAYRKRWRQIHVDGSGTVDLHLAKDFAAYSALATNIFSGSSTETEARIYTPGIARAGSIKFTGTSAFEIDAVTIAYNQRSN